MSRKLIGERPLTIAERQQRYRQRRVAQRYDLIAQLRVIAGLLEGDAVTIEHAGSLLRAAIDQAQRS